MIEINRQQLKEDEVWQRLHDVVKKGHKIADHTINTLLENKHIENFCEEAQHFMIVNNGNGPLFLHYDVSSWYNEGRAAIRIDAVGVYDDLIEYTAASTRQLHGAKNASIPNIN